MTSATHESSEAGQLIQDTADRLLREQCSKELVDAAESGTWPAELWRTLFETGLPWASAPERLGGAGLPLPESLGLLRLVGSHAVPVPLAETLIASALLGEDEAVEALPEGPVALVVAADVDDLRAVPAGNGLRLDGSVAAVPFAEEAELLVVPVAAEDGLHLLRVAPAKAELLAGRNIAGEPHADVRFTATEVAASEVSRVTSLGSIEQVVALMALSRALMMAGAMQSLLDLSVAYSLERKQFGRQIAKFQAIQQQLAVLAGDTAAAIRAAEGAVEVFASGFGDAFADGRLAAAAVREAGIAKSRAGEAAGRGAEIAHQVHGAMGFTYEHRLHQRSRRLWAWRDQYGSENWWQQRLGRELCAVGADAIWDLVTRPPR